MSANVDIISLRRRGVLLLPLEGIGFTGHAGQVKILLSSGPAARVASGFFHFGSGAVPPAVQAARQIRIGVRNDTDAEVLSGLKPGDKVVVPKFNGKRRTIDINDNGNGD